MAGTSPTIYQFSPSYIFYFYIPSSHPYRQLLLRPQKGRVVEVKEEPEEEVSFRYRVPVPYRWYCAHAPRPEAS